MDKTQFKNRIVVNDANLKSTYNAVIMLLVCFIFAILLYIETSKSILILAMMFITIGLLMLYLVARNQYRVKSMIIDDLYEQIDEEIIYDIDLIYYKNQKALCVVNDSYLADIIKTLDYDITFIRVLKNRRGYTLDYIKELLVDDLDEEEIEGLNLIIINEAEKVVRKMRVIEIAGEYYGFK